jgi:Helicase HerA, central domain
MADRGTFWIGNVVDPTTGKAGAEQLTIGSSDLTTHGVIVGMTGSGKTGLGIVLLEEALSAGIPVLAIDPKGDLGNLALVFPDLAPSSFEPWVNPSEAQAAGLDTAAFAAKQAETWQAGLAAQGIGAERLATLKAAADVTIYTPGSTAGTPINIVGSLRAPALSWDAEAETMRDEIQGTVTSLLALVGIASDPLSSREHVLLANLLETAWRTGQSLDLGTLIGQVAQPPIRKLGVFDIDQFFPPKERTELAFRLNALVASPTFAAWGDGVPLDIQSMLFESDGKPRCAVVYLAHLSDEERQFAVTLILSKLVTWMRTQSGTPDLRVLTYVDEVYGYVPPTASPPAKRPLLTLLKQGRAFGCGLVLSTQNPVDIDYKAMANAGTWLVGRLQTENDKARVLEALRSAAGGTDVAQLDVTIGALQKRQFLLVSAKASAPRLLASRWAMSYLRGPLTKEEIHRLRPAVAAAPTGTVPAEAVQPVQAAVAVGAAETSVAPPVAARVEAVYLDGAAPWASSIGAAASGPLRAFVAARCSLRYDDTAAGVDEQQEFEAVYGPLDEAFDLDSETIVDFDDRDFRPASPPAAAYVLPGVPIADAPFWNEAERSIERRLVERRPLELSRNRKLKLASRPGESAEAFAARCDEAAQAGADAEAAKLRDRLEARRDRLEKALAQAERRVEELTADERSRQANELIAGAGAVLGALLGGRRSARSIATAVSGAASRRGVSSRVASRKDSAKERLDDAQAELEAIEQELLDDVAEIDERWREVAADIDTVAIRLEATDVAVTALRLVWVPTA